MSESWTLTTMRTTIRIASIIGNILLTCFETVTLLFLIKSNKNKSIIKMEKKKLNCPPKKSFTSTLGDWGRKMEWSDQLREIMSQNLKRKGRSWGCSSVWRFWVPSSTACKTWRGLGCENNKKLAMQVNFVVKVNVCESRVSIRQSWRVSWSVVIVVWSCWRTYSLEAHTEILSGQFGDVFKLNSK